MAISGNRVIALEEHYCDDELTATFEGTEGRAPEIRKHFIHSGRVVALASCRRTHR
jgi:hypothetical protein